MLILLKTTVRRLFQNSERDSIFSERQIEFTNAPLIRFCICCKFTISFNLIDMGHHGGKELSLPLLLEASLAENSS